MRDAAIAAPDVAGDLLHTRVRRLILALRGPHWAKRLAGLAGVSHRTAEDWVYRDRRPGTTAALTLLSSDPAALAAFNADMAVLAQARQAAERARRRVHGLDQGSGDRGVVVGAVAQPDGRLDAGAVGPADGAGGGTVGATVVSGVVSDGV